MNDRERLTVPEFLVTAGGEQLSAMRVSLDPERFVYGEPEVIGWLRDRLENRLSAFSDDDVVELCEAHGDANYEGDLYEELRAERRRRFPGERA